ncbi:MAG: hypothetical protein JL50_15130 [Peptococcaceae bacterium BICA1-7]|nr:MAG: hypothetical protein JL50_15130 [Peptococcaceae bacterium BICA1-7]HBV96881.1 hypothetical protein [Desulfotomaculum sp.]
MVNISTKSFFGRVKKAAGNNPSAENLLTEIEMITENLKISKVEIDNLRNQLVVYQEKEQLVSHILINAQLNAHKIELEARQSARLIIERCKLDLNEKKIELDKLKSIVSRLRNQYREILRPCLPVDAPPDKAGGSSVETP